MFYLGKFIFHEEETRTVLVLLFRLFLCLTVLI